MNRGDARVAGFAVFVGRRALAVVVDEIFERALGVAQLLFTHFLHLLGVQAHGVGMGPDALKCLEIGEQSGAERSFPKITTLVQLL